MEHYGNLVVYCGKNIYHMLYSMQDDMYHKQEVVIAGKFHSNIVNCIWCKMFECRWIIA